MAGCWDMGGGEKVGTITRLNKSGVFCKTWEAEIIRGGFNGGSGVMGQAFHFTIENADLVKEVEKYMNNQQEVKITYKMEGITFCRSDSDNFLAKIEPLNEVNAPTPTGQGKEAPTVGVQTTVNSEILQILQNQEKMAEENRKILRKLAGSKK